MQKRLADRCGQYDARYHGVILAHDNVRMYDARSVCTEPGAAIKYRTRFAVYSPRIADHIEGAAHRSPDSQAA